MPKVDGLIFVGPQPGQGALLLNCIDPSVIDENNALLVDPSLDPLNPENGYKGKQKYPLSLLNLIARYRAAQKARCRPFRCVCS